MPQAPPRPDQAGRRKERRWLPVMAVLAVILFVVGGARGVGEAIEGPPGPPTGFDGILTIQPEPGWEEETRNEEDGFHELLLRSGTAGLYVVALEDYADTSEGLAQEYLDIVLDDQFESLTIGDAERLSISDGLPGIRFGYLGVTSDGVSFEGVVTGVVSRSGNAVIFDGFAPEGDLAWAVDDIRKMIEGADVS